MDGQLGSWELGLKIARFVLNFSGYLLTCRTFRGPGFSFFKNVFLCMHARSLKTQVLLTINRWFIMFHIS